MPCAVGRRLLADRLAQTENEFDIYISAVFYIAITKHSLISTKGIAHGLFCEFLARDLFAQVFSGFSFTSHYNSNLLLGE
jgi:hypothetical protein